MHCLLFWLPILLLPLPAASPFLTILFLVTYAVRMRPCAYCFFIIVGLIMAPCVLYSEETSVLMESHKSSSVFSTMFSSLSGSGSSVQNQTNAVGHPFTLSAEDRERPAHGAPPPLASDSAARYARERVSHASSSHSSSPLSCWVDWGSSSTDGERDVDVTLGWLSRPTQRARSTILGDWRKWRKTRTRTWPQSHHGKQHDKSLLATRNTANDQEERGEGIFVGVGDIGFNLKLYAD